jgi:hypothetical protein
MTSAIDNVEKVSILPLLMCCSSTQRRRAFAGRHVFVLASSSGLRGHKRTYLTILKSADHALFKMVHKWITIRRMLDKTDILDVKKYLKII